MRVYRRCARLVRGASSQARGAVGRLALVIGVTGAIAGCNGSSALEELLEARRLSADLLVQFTKAADASNRAVMADTDEASIAFAREAEHSTEAVQKGVDTLSPLLKSLRYPEEETLLQEFAARFAEYRALDRTILDLAVENTNLKAQRLSFGSAQEAADAVRDALGSIAPSDPANSWHVRALAANALASVREIQVLQAPHIAEAGDTAMAAIEKRMASAEATARTALRELASLVQPASRPKVAAANASLDRLMEINAQIIDLSRRNTNVRSQALSLNKKGKITAACEDRLRAIQAALANRGFMGTR